MGGWNFFIIILIIIIISIIKLTKKIKSEDDNADGRWIITVLTFFLILTDVGQSTFRNESTNIYLSGNFLKTLRL